MFAQMLATKVTPLYEKGKEPQRSGNPAPDPSKGWAVRKAKTEAEYRKAMGSRWISTHGIEILLGLARGSVRDYMLDRVREGKVEQRKNIHPFSNGFEWRWK